MTRPPLAGLRVLIAEDDYFIAMDLAKDLRALGALILGPVPTSSAALRALNAPDAPDLAILDIDLAGERSYALADILGARGVPYAFVTGYDPEVLPRRYGDVPIMLKPHSDRELGDLVCDLAAGRRGARGAAAAA